MMCNNCGDKNYKIFIKLHFGNVVVCKNCGLVFLNPMKSYSEYEKYYKYKNERNENLSIESILKREVSKKEVVNILKPYLRKKTLLDIGCGHGILLNYAKRYCSKCEGLEMWKYAIESIKKNFDIFVHYGSLEKNNIKKKYDIVTLTSVIEHFVNPRKSLRQINKILNDNGYLFISTFDYRQMSFKRKGIKKFFKFVHTYYFTNKTLKSLLQQSGFKIIKTYNTKRKSGKSGELRILAQKSKDGNLIKDKYKNLIMIFYYNRIKYSIINYLYRIMDIIKIIIKKIIN